MRSGGSRASSTPPQAGRPSPPQAGRTLPLDRFPPGIRQQIARLRTGSFVAEAVTGVAAGTPGVGKRHRLAALGQELVLESSRTKEATEQHRRVPPGELRLTDDWATG